MRRIGYHDTGLIKKIYKKSPKCAQSLGLVQFEVPSPQRVKRKINKHSTHNMADSAHSPIWECHICDKTFATNSGKNKHVRIKHEGIRFTYAGCNKSYTSKRNLERHLINATRVCTSQNKQLGESWHPPSN